LVNAMVVFLPYQIRWLCSERRRYRASPDEIGGPRQLGM